MQRIWRNNQLSTWRPNAWDGVALVIVGAIFALLAYGAQQMAAPYHIGEQIPISLGISQLPYYALRTIFRMILAMVISLLFSFIVGTLAAKNKHAERLIIPAIDILQSVPVLGFLSITVVGFIKFFPNSILGPECAAIFAIFVAQVWNITLGLYQSLRNVPHELKEAASMFHLSAWQRYWRVEIPFALPSLIWNMMLSMSAGWFFVTVCEAISVNHQTILLPGVGSYIAVAIEKANTDAVIAAIVTMLVVIMLYDQILFRPLIRWSDRFKFEASIDEEKPSSLFVSILERTRLLTLIGQFFTTAFTLFVNLNLGQKRRILDPEVLERPKTYKAIISIWLWYSLVIISGLLAVVALLGFIFHSLSAHEVFHVLLLGVYTTLRVAILIVICSLIWVPVGVWIGMRPRATHIAQPIAQFLAAFPANLIFPVVVMAIIHFHLNVNIWTTPLMILGTQWYLLFNIIAGASTLPKDLYQVTQNFGVKGWLWWRKFILPGIFPYYVTGAITAAGGAWNASIVAEVVNWGHHVLRATGLGAYISTYTTSGDFPRIALGIGIMCVYVLLFNRLVWQPLYNLAEKRYRMF
ncbi:MAG: sulfonate ABC transporter permease [Gammaproteobacteria bacterium CG11_big_fil_rev_8_21_14_0_20_46_22]|nr:MAG: sulfonate ABC transporter permease [Gammaproteobacteria bacterium CG12_big_fil_rev_8_21_14_0_65_46_12]PIR12057.1 MAG: sulfonate ABC transporter permease [Gammaproteobacteria bacterium CG11_big_fil_rev_8_21_14_0_20_46_22]